MTAFKKAARLEDFEKAPSVDDDVAVAPTKTFDEDVPKGPTYQADLGERFASNGSRLLIKKEFETKVDVTPRVLDVSSAFGIGVDEAKKFSVFDDVGLRIEPGDVVYVTGQSGGGKSQLLRILEERLGSQGAYAPLLDGATIQAPKDKALVDSLGSSTEEAIKLLTYVGLNDAFLYLRRFDELSDGQKYRYRLARALDARARTLVFDEFCSVLDRTTARVVAHLLRKLARELHLTLIVATAHEDLIEDLDPDVYVRKRVGKDALIDYRTRADPPCTLLKDSVVEEGSIEDYEALKEFHYRAGAPAFLYKVYRLRIGEEVVGVLCYTGPLFQLSQRYVALPELKALFKEDPKKYMAFINANVVRIARVVVHPRLRGISLAVKLVRESMPLTKKKYVETIAAMAKFNPFFERAGMRLVERPDAGARGLTKGWDECLEKLEALGCEIDYLKSREANLRWLKTLSPERLNDVKVILLKYFHFYFKERLQGATTLEDLADSLREIPAPMSYLFWDNPDVKVVANQSYLEVDVERENVGAPGASVTDAPLAPSSVAAKPDADLVKELEEAAKHV